MKYVLVDRNDNIVDRVDLGSNVGLSGAKTFFVGRKQIPYEKFIQLWRVMAEDEYNRQYIEGHKQNKQFEWWKTEESYLDLEAPMTKSGEPKQK